MKAKMTWKKFIGELTFCLIMFAGGGYFIIEVNDLFVNISGALALLLGLMCLPRKFPSNVSKDEINSKEKLNKQTQ